MVKKLTFLFLSLFLLIPFTVSSAAFSEVAVSYNELNLEDFFAYQKMYAHEEIPICAANSTKAYMDYRAIRAEGSTQYRFIRQNLKVDGKTGLLYDKDGFIAVALGSYFGKIGSRYYFTLSDGQVLPLVKAEAKADRHVHNGCAHGRDGSVIEMVIDSGRAAKYFGLSANGYVASGNFNRNRYFHGRIVKIERVTAAIDPDYYKYSPAYGSIFPNNDIFNYAAGY